MRWILAILFVGLVLFCSSVPMWAQAEDVVGAGFSWNQYATPQINGNLFYAHKLTEGLYSYNLVDVMPKPEFSFKSLRTIAVTTSVTSGIAKHVKTMGSARVYLTGTLGVSAGGEDVGPTYSTGGVVKLPLGDKGWCFLLSARLLKSTITDFQGIYGIALGWGK